MRWNRISTETIVVVALVGQFAALMVLMQATHPPSTMPSSRAQAQRDLQSTLSPNLANQAKHSVGNDDGDDKGSLIAEPEQYDDDDESQDEPSPDKQRLKHADRAQSQEAIASLLASSPPLDEAAYTYMHARAKAAYAEIHRLSDLRKKVPAAIAQAKKVSGYRRYVCRYCRPAELTVASYNIFGVRRHWDERWPVLIEAVKHVMPDVVFLQEVQRTEAEVTQAHLLAKALGWDHVYYARAHGADESEGGEEGVAIVARKAADKVQTIKLEPYKGSPDKNQRNFMHAEFTVAGDKVHLLGAHFTYHPIAQCDAVKQVLLYIHDVIPPSDTVILTGDLNTYMSFEWPLAWVSNTLPPTLRMHTSNPCRTAYATLHQAAGPSAADVDFRDSFKSVHPNDPGWTFTNFEYTNYTELYERSTRPDRMLIRTSRWVEQTAAIFGDALDGFVRQDLYASDHRGLVVSYSRLPASIAAQSFKAQRLWVQHPGITGEPNPHVLQAIFAASVKFNKASPPSNLFNTAQRKPLLIDKTKPNQVIAQRLSREAYVSQISVSLSCAEAEEGFRGAPPAMVLQAQFFHHDPLVIPKWVALRTYTAGTKDIVWTFPDKLKEGDRGMAIARLVFTGAAKKIAVCSFDLKV
eukprot:m.80050 g.80050  ORF g.80050 m.80050 type:complete len:635 (+) comp14532_c0_seq1:130-2034(+)